MPVAALVLWCSHVSNILTTLKPEVYENQATGRVETSLKLFKTLTIFLTLMLIFFLDVFKCIVLNDTWQGGLEGKQP